MRQSIGKITRRHCRLQCPHGAGPFPHAARGGRFLFGIYLPQPFGTDGPGPRKPFRRFESGLPAAIGAQVGQGECKRKMLCRQGLADRFMHAEFKRSHVIRQRNLLAAVDIGIVQEMRQKLNLWLIDQAKILAAVQAYRGCGPIARLRKTENTGRQAGRDARRVDHSLAGLCLLALKQSDIKEAPELFGLAPAGGHDQVAGLIQSPHIQQPIGAGQKQSPPVHLGILRRLKLCNQYPLQ